MDIGGFLRLYPLTLAQPYDYLLKLHTKSHAQWRRDLAFPLCGTAQRVRHCLTLFRTNPKIGMLGTMRLVYTESPHSIRNSHYLGRFASQLRISHAPCQFVAGTMFWIRASVLRDTLGKHDLEKFRLQLNTFDTFDAHWYLRNYRDVGLTLATAKEHFDKHPGRFRNCLDARRGGSKNYLADSMPEHAFERLFGLLVKSRGMMVPGVLSRGHARTLL